MKKTALIIVVFLMTALPALANAAVPPDVENVSAEAGDSEVALSWDAVSGAAGYKIYYGTESVTGEDEANYTDVVEAGDATEYVVAQLENGVTYYFAVTAVSADGTESEYYSGEVSAVPKATEVVSDDDAEPPKVVSAEALYNTEVKVVFSEAVVLPSEYPEDAFTIQDNDTLEILDVLSAVPGSDANTVILETASQTADTSYIVTVGIDVEDKAGNPIISGVSDVAPFTGSGTKKPEENEDSEGPIIAGVESLSDTSVKVTFNEKVSLSIDPTENFNIALESDPGQALDITKIELEDKDFSVLLTTEKQSEVTYVLTVSDVVDKSGNPINTEEDANKATFTGKGETTLLDLVAPENITNLVSSVVNGAVKLSWTASLNSENDLVEQILYKSTDDGATYDNGTPISGDATSYSVYGLEPGTEYYFKVTAKDEAGNESSGTVISAVLPATGPGIGLLALASLAGGFLARRRKS